MNGAWFVMRGLWFFRWSYLGVLAGAALGAMVLLGALLAGDSVRASLRQVAEARLGKVDEVLVGGEHLFRAALADALPEVAAAPVLFVQATATVQRSGRALGQVRVLGVDRRFWRLRPGAASTMEDDGYAGPQDREMWINGHLAWALGCGTGEALVLRMEKPGMIAGDAPLAGKSGDMLSMTGGVSEVCGDPDFGCFSLEATQLPQATVWVPIERLQKALGLEGKANLLLMHKRDGHGHDALSASLKRRCTLEDYGLSLTDIPLADSVEVRTSRIFFDREVAAAIRKTFPAAQPVITYLANTISIKDRQIPYSMVTAVDEPAAPFLAGMPGGVVLNAWAAEGLAAKTGDQVRIDYYALDAANRLVERHANLPVAGVVPLTGLAADRQWMPDFPGVAEAEKAADWEPGVPIDLKRIRPQDEAYWDAHRGTPKLFLPLETGRKWFGNRWGECTALRVPATVASRSAMKVSLLDAMTPALAGLLLQDVGRQAMAAAASPVEFAGLLLGMSVFLMVAAVALTAMLLRFHIEERNRESGLLEALGIPARRIRRWRLMEGLCVVVAGSVVGGWLAVGYTRFLLGCLATIWSGSGGGAWIEVHVGWGTLLGGGLGFVCLMMGVIGLVTRKQAARGAASRMAAGTEEVRRAPSGRVPWRAVGWAGLGVGAVAGSGLMGAAGAFFLAGFACLLAGLEMFRWALGRRSQAEDGELTPRRMAVLNCGRRVARSWVVAGCLASGVFLVVGVAVFRKQSGDEWRERHSGAGGFAFWVETTSAAKRGSGTQNGLIDGLSGVPGLGEVLPVRMGAGDDASCFNLNTVSRPRLLATDVEALAKRDAFSIKHVMAGTAKNWNALREGEALRAFVDETTLLWVMKKKLGDRLIYQDEWGRDFPIEIAGVLADSVFQGSLVVDEARFLKHYPSAAGARLFLVDGGADVEAERAAMQQALVDQGAMVMSTRERLEAFHGVENTYLLIFHVLGGLGVIIGSAGLGILTARNLLERRYEFAILHILGVLPTVTRRVVWLETRMLICWGLGIGWLAAMVAIAPSLAGGLGWRALAWSGLLLLFMAGNAWLWSWLCVRRRLTAMFEAQQE